MIDIQIPGFEMLEKLGQGGMATVWKARQISLDRIVAIKILSSRLADDPSDVEMFLKEAQQAAKLKHPGIVQVYDASAENGLYYFIMEYVAGYTVGDWIRRKGVLDEKDVLLVAECVADALEYAWNFARIIHCDIKPDNIIIDADGTVKIADLGLARTLSAMTDQEDSEEVMGTPAYISPEQAMGKAGIDFRADIYSLGAMLYHLATGKMLFAGQPEDTIMECQVNSTAPDPLDLNPALSKPICWLVEKMLAKQPEWRPASWEEVRKDVDRVKKKIVPIGCLTEEQTSTVSRSSKRTRKDLKRVVNHIDDTPSSGAGVKLAIVAGIIACFVVAGIVSTRGRVVPVTANSDGVVSMRNEQKGGDADGSMREHDAKEMFEYALQWESQYPDRFAEAIDRFSHVVTQTAGTKYSLMASDEVKKLSAKWQDAKSKVMAQLKSDAEYYVDNGELEYAAGLYDKYDGVFKNDTDVDRRKMAEQLRALKRRQEEDQISKRKAVEQKLNGFLDEVVFKLLESGVSDALSVVETALTDKDLGDRRESFNELRKVLQSSARIDQRILDSFKAQTGKTVTILLNAGRKDVRIEGVKDDKILGKQPYGTAGVMMSVEIELNDLSVREKLARMGDDNDPSVALVKGLMANGSGSVDYAKAYFAKTHELISERLIMKISSELSSQLEDDAHDALVRSLKAIEVSVPSSFDEWVWGAAIEKKEFSESDARQVVSFVKTYREKFGQTQFGRRADPVLEALLSKAALQEGAKNVSGNSVRVPAGGQLSSEIAGIVGDNEKTIALILAKNLNIAKEDINVLTDSSGSTYKVSIISPGIEDISPVAAFKGLREFYCGTVEPGNTHDKDLIAPLSDISSLSGLPLEVLYIAQTSVKTLDAVVGMKLRELDISRTRISDLSPLKYMKLDRLAAADTMVKDISPLRGMSLQALDLGGTRVYDFKPLLRMPLKHMVLDGTQFKDLSLIKDAPIKYLSLSDTNVDDLKYLAGMSVEFLNLKGLLVKDISPLMKLPLKGLNLSGANLKDYSCLAKLPLEKLILRETSLKDINFVQGMNLVELDVSGTGVSDLRPLMGCNIRVLDISNTKVSDLMPLCRLPLKDLSCYGVSASLMPLVKTRLQNIWIDDPEDNYDNMRILFHIPTMETINWKPLEYWRNR